MAESASFVCSKCGHLIKPEHPRELSFESTAQFYQYDHKGQCPFARAAEWNESPNARRKRLDSPEG